MLDMLEGMRRVFRGTLEAVEGELCLLEVLEALEALEVMRCVLLCISEAVEGGLCSMEVPGLPEVLEVMRCVLLCIAGGCGGWALFAGGFRGARGDAPYAALYVVGRGR